MSISDFLSSLVIDCNNRTGNSQIGCKIQYYMSNDKLYFCTINTARQILINWWGNLPVDEKNKFK